MSREICAEIAKWMQSELAFSVASDEFRAALPGVVAAMLRDYEKDPLDDAIDKLAAGISAETIWRLLLEPLQDRQGELEYEFNPEDGGGISLSMKSADDELKRVDLAPLVIACADELAGFARSDYDPADDSWKVWVLQLKQLRESLSGLVSHIDAALATTPVAG